MHGWLPIGAAAALCVPNGMWAQAPKRFMQVELLKTIKGKKAKAGDAVKARAVQAVILPGGVTIPEGTTLVGEVREADEKSVAISFDAAELKGKTTPVKLSIRAAMMPGAAPMRDAGDSPLAVSTPTSRPMAGGPPPLSGEAESCGRDEYRRFRPRAAAGTQRGRPHGFGDRDVGGHAGGR
jgi:hypothetical protein